MVEQWTITYNDDQTNERAIVTVRFAPSVVKELIEFDVQLNPIPIQDNQGKDVTVNWKFHNGFKAGGAFWTDSNGLQMQRRDIKQNPYKKNESNMVDDKAGPNF